jgi:hypothetical protein
MNKKNLLKIIKQEIALLADFVDGFNDTENLHPMEVDLAVSKAKDIYNELLLLKGDDAIREKPLKAEVQVPKSKVEPIKFKEPVDHSALIEAPVEIAEEIVPENEPDTELELIPEEVLPFRELEEEKEKVSSEIVEPVETKEVIEEEIRDVSNHNEVIEESVPKDEPVETFENKNTDDEEGKSEELVKTQEIPDEKAPSAKKTGKSPKAFETKEKVSGEIMADKFSKDSFSINDMLAGVKNNKNLASSLKDSPISDLKKAIKLNDRIWYINELFNKNSSTFEKAVDTVNSSADLDKALEYLFMNFKWDQERKSTINFLELVFRRFATK